MLTSSNGMEDQLRVLEESIINPEHLLMDDDIAQKGCCFRPNTKTICLIILIVFVMTLIIIILVLLFNLIV